MGRARADTLQPCRSARPVLITAALLFLTTGVLATDGGYPPPPGPYRVGTAESTGSDDNLAATPRATPPLPESDKGPSDHADVLFGAQRETPRPSATMSNPTPEPPAAAPFVDRPSASPRPPTANPASASTTTWRDKPGPTAEPTAPSRPLGDPASSANLIFRPADAPRY